MIDLGGRDFSFDPKTLELRPESGGAQHGLSFDDWGRKFVCSNSAHVQVVMFEDRYLERNPYVTAPPRWKSSIARRLVPALTEPGATPQLPVAVNWASAKVRFNFESCHSRTGGRPGSRRIRLAASTSRFSAMIPSSSFWNASANRKA